MATFPYQNLMNFQTLSQEMERMRSEMDRTFAGLMGRIPQLADAGVFPTLNIIEERDKILVQAELPGVKPEDFEISVQDNTLILRGERKAENVGNMSFHRRERLTGKFQRALTLPVDINLDAAEAKCEHGVLQLVLPKAESAIPKKIPVAGSQGGANSTATVEISS